MHVLLIERLETEESKKAYEAQEAIIKEREAQSRKDWEAGHFNSAEPKSAEALRFSRETNELRTQALDARDFSNGRLVADLGDISITHPLPTSGLFNTITVDDQVYTILETDYTYANSPMYLGKGHASKTVGDGWTDKYSMHTVYYGVVPFSGALDYQYPILRSMGCKCKWPALHELHLVEE